MDCTPSATGSRPVSPAEGEWCLPGSREGVAGSLFENGRPTVGERGEYVGDLRVDVEVVSVGRKWGSLGGAAEAM